MLPNQTDRLDRIYASAVTHSRLVYFLKIALPVTGLVLVGAFIALSYVRTLVPDEISVASAAIEGGSIIMNAPIIAGQGANNIPYRIQAQRAVQEIGDTSRILFEAMEAELPLSSGGMAYINAEEGLFDQSQNNVTFTKPFDVKLLTGLKARFENGVFDMQTSNFQTDNGVDIEFKGGALSAQTIELTNGGEQVLLRGGVKMRISASMAKRTQ